MQSITAHKILKDFFVKKGGGQSLMKNIKAKKRWFVMDDYSITYYEKSDEKKPKGNIFIQQIKEVKIGSKEKELQLVTAFRTFQLTPENIETTKEWEKAINERKNDRDTVKKVVVKAEKLIKKSAEVEKRSKELCSYIEKLEKENKKLKDENEKLKKEFGDLQKG